MIAFKNKNYPISAVYLTDSYCLNAFEKEVSYLTSFDTDKLLSGFRETAGIDTKNKSRYPGWENMLIGGHCVGHYLSACVNAFQNPVCSKNNKEKLILIISELINGFDECQKKIGTGFLFGAVLTDKKNIELQFDNVEKNQTNIITQAWVPWYTMHKLFEGLIKAASMDSKSYGTIVLKAQSILSNLTKWIYNRISKWDKNTLKTVLSIEYGGMNDCLYEYYRLSGNKTALECAKIFDDENLFKTIAYSKKEQNILNGRHANTTIPKFTGALNRYVVTGEKRFFEYAKRFWKIVTSSHTYVTGGNSTWEHFGEDNKLYSKLSNCNCETCNSYNMLKLTNLLFMITGKKEYADWYEHTFINSILSSQNPESGMTTYFQPMATGFFKVYSTPFESFWCCTGTGMENFSKLTESFYYHNENEIIVNQYISSEIYILDKNLKICQKSSFPKEENSQFTFHGNYDGKIRFRIPEWTKGKLKIIINDKKYNYKKENGFAVVKHKFSNETKITVTIPMTIRAYNLPDKKDAYAFMYGPYVLSAELGTFDKQTATNGVNVQVPQKAIIDEKYVPSRTDVVTVKGISVNRFIKNIDQNLIKMKNQPQLKFKLLNTDSNLIYSIHYKQFEQRYGLYFRFLDERSSKKNQNDKESQCYINANKLDTVQPGYGQYENDELHNMIEYGEKSTGQTYRGTSRHANKNGSFSYRMIVDPDGTDLLIMMDPCDKGKSLCIKAGKNVIYKERVNLKNKGGFVKKIIPLDYDLLKKEIKTLNYEGKKVSVLELNFSGIDGEQSANLCEFIYTLKR